MPDYQPPPANYQELISKAEGIVLTYKNPYKSGLKIKLPSKKLSLNLGFGAVLLLLIGGTFGYVHSRTSQPVIANVESVKAVKPYTQSEYDKIRSELKKSLKNERLASVKGASDSALSNVEVFTNDSYGYSFEYQSDIYEVLETVKEKASQVLEEDAASRFTKERNLQPPDLLYKAEVATLTKELGAVDGVTDGEDKSKEIKVPFRVYVYNNLDDLSVQEWFDDYHYFPYEWGNDTEKLKPNLEMKRGEIVGEYAQIEETKQVKYIYFNHNQKIYLIWIGDLELASQRKLIGNMLISFKFSEKVEQVFENKDYNFSIRIPEGDETVEFIGNRIEIKDKDRKLIRVFTVFDANVKDKDALADWWSSNIYSEIGSFQIPGDYDAEQKEMHPHHLNRNGIAAPTLIVTPSATTTSVAMYESSYYMYYDFGKPFIIHYSEEATEDPIPQAASWPIITITPLN